VHPLNVSESQNFGTGDPEWVNIVPPSQYLGKYIFFTDPTMRNTNLVMVRRKAQDGTFKDVTLDCLSGPLSGWLPIGSTDYEYTRVDMVVQGAGVNGCDNGLHEMHSDEPFGATVWGWDTTVSYAYPAGAKVEFINDVHVPPTQ
jgi:IgGFc binding protein